MPEHTDFCILTTGYAMVTDPIKLFRLIPLIFVLVGLGLLAGATYSYRSTQEFLRTARPATGEVIGYARRTDSEGEISYFPIIEYTPAGAEEPIEFISSTGGTRSYAVGARVPLRYDPALPFSAAIDSPGDLWLAAGVLGGLGALFTVIGGVIFWLFRPGGAFDSPHGYTNSA